MKTTTLILSDTGVLTSKAYLTHNLALHQMVNAGLQEIIFNHAFRYRDTCIRTLDLGLMRKPLNKAILLRLLAWRHCWFEDKDGNKQRISIWYLMILLFRRLHDGVQGKWQMQRFKQQVADYELTTENHNSKYCGTGPVMYLRTDLVFGIKSGGSVGHIAGVLNNIHSLLGDARFFTTDNIPTVSRYITPTIIKPGRRYADIPETRALLFGMHMAETIIRKWQEPPPRFIYQRYSVNNITGLMLADKFQVPLIIEYNGSEVWINRHWGKKLDNEKLAIRLEHLNLLHADLVVVVSQVLADELIERGVPSKRILVNPNGVDPERYRPDINGSHLRADLGIRDKQIIGFIGTFGPWHGAEILAEAAAKMFQDDPSLRDRVAILFIGDGQNMPLVRKIVAQREITDCCHFTGLVPQTEGPLYMAICDLLVSPHVPNPDGSRFFGSPTKLFEYMAMGKPIVASALDQIGEVLTHNHNAVLVPPGDANVLASEMATLLHDNQRSSSLGEAARKSILEYHSWRRHTEYILAALDERIAKADNVKHEVLGD